MQWFKTTTHNIKVRAGEAYSFSSARLHTLHLLRGPRAAALIERLIYNAHSSTASGWAGHRGFDAMLANELRNAGGAHALCSGVRGPNALGLALAVLTRRGLVFGRSYDERPDRMIDINITLLNYSNINTIGIPTGNQVHRTVHDC